APHLAFVNKTSDIGFDFDQGTMFLDVQYHPFNFIIDLIQQEWIILWEPQTKFHIAIWFHAKDDDLDFLTHLNDVSCVGNITPHLTLMNQSFESRWEFDKGSIVQHPSNPPSDALPRLITWNRGIDLGWCAWNFTPEHQSCCILLCFLFRV